MKRKNKIKNNNELEEFIKANLHYLSKEKQDLFHSIMRIDNKIYQKNKKYAKNDEIYNG